MPTRRCSLATSLLRQAVCAAGASVTGLPCLRPADRRPRPPRWPAPARSPARKDGDGNYVATFAGASPGITGLGRHASWQSCIDHCPKGHKRRRAGRGAPATALAGRQPRPRARARRGLLPPPYLLEHAEAQRGRLRQAEADRETPAEFLTHVSPLGWEHINLTGEYRWPGAPTHNGST